MGRLCFFCRISCYYQSVSGCDFYLPQSHQCYLWIWFIGVIGVSKRKVSDCESCSVIGSNITYLLAIHCRPSSHSSSLSPPPFDLLEHDRLHSLCLVRAQKIYSDFLIRLLMPLLMRHMMWLCLLVSESIPESLVLALVKVASLQDV